MKKVTFKVTDEKLFNKMVVDVDTSGLKNNGTDYKGNHLGFYGSLDMELEDGKGSFITTGDFGINDYKENLGFILTRN